MSSLAMVSALSGCRLAGCAKGIRSTRGVVVGVKAIASDVKYTVDFEKGGTKNLMGSYAKLTKIN